MAVGQRASEYLAGRNALVFEIEVLGFTLLV